jgi:hypothetical protein
MKRDAIRVARSTRSESRPAAAAAQARVDAGILGPAPRMLCRSRMHHTSRLLAIPTFALSTTTACGLFGIGGDEPSASSDASASASEGSLDSSGGSDGFGSDGSGEADASDTAAEAGDSTGGGNHLPSAVATAIAAGRLHSCAIVTGGAVRCWGANGAGELGEGSIEDATAPQPVISLP